MPDERLITFHPQISSIQDDLRTYNDNVSRISDLHNRSLNNTDDAAAERLTQQLEELVADTSALSNVLKRRIKALERQPGSGRDGQIRKQQVCMQSTAYRGPEMLKMWCNSDRPGETKVCRSHPELPDSRAAVPVQVQAAHGTAVQDWYARVICI